MDSDDEEWLPKVLKRWNALIADPKGDAKRYSAFLRFTFKSYGIPARAHIRKILRGFFSYHHTLRIEYVGSVRTMEDMRKALDEIRDIVRQFKPYGTIEYDYCRGLVYYDTASIWERDKRKGPTYFWNVMCVGKGDVPYLPSDVRKLILGRV